METSVNSSKDNAIVVLNVITKLVQDIQKKISQSNVKPKECPELKLLKEKCCDDNVLVAITAFHGVKNLVEEGYFLESQTVMMLVSLLPSIHHYGPMISTVGDILLLDLRNQISEKKDYVYSYKSQFQHPIMMILKYNKEKSWCEIYHFILQLLNNKEMDVEFKVKFLRPIFRDVFWGSSWRGSPFQLKLFSALLMQSHDLDLMDFTLEVLLWQEMDFQYCLFLQDFFSYLLLSKPSNSQLILSALSGTMAVTIKWLILQGYNPGVWINVLKSALEVDSTSGSVVLSILTDAITCTPSLYINSLINICKFILLNGCCSRNIAFKFAAVVLNWFVSTSTLANPLHKTLEEILRFIYKNDNGWNDRTSELLTNKYFTVYGKVNKDVRFSVDLILMSNSWKEDNKSILVWLKNLKESDEQRMHLKLHSFIYGIIISESDSSVIRLCLEILLKLIDSFKEISFSLLCLLFYKLGREKEPTMQRLYLFFLPKLAMQKENIPLVMGIIESLKRGNPKVMTPIIIQLYLCLWKQDNRTYSYLHKMLHESSPSADFAWEVNVSKAIALKDICRMAPHLHAKDLVGVLSTILNESVDHASGVPSAIALEAVTELCKAFVIDIAGTWNAIQPKLCVDKRPNVIVSLCKFFGEIPKLKTTGQKPDGLVRNIVPVLWKYTFFNNKDIIRNALQALSNFEVENLDLVLLPESYRVDIKLPKEEKDSKTDVLDLPYVPPECWVQFLEKIDKEVLQEGGQLIVVMIERELNSLPRGLFYNPREKPEPLSYSYLPGRSICRALVDRLLRYSRENPTTIPGSLRQILRIVSNKYSKTLPPLNWNFLEKLMSIDSECLCLCLSLVAKQGSVSSSAQNILENYVKSACWDSSKFDEILLFYNLLPMLSKSLLYNTLQNFLESTIALCLSDALQTHAGHFEKILKSLSDTFRNQTVQPSHKTLIARQLEKVLDLIPPDHDIMKWYAECASEFPVKSIEEITSVKEDVDITKDWLRRAVTIRCAIAMRSDIKNPLIWLNEFTEAAAQFPQEQNFIMSTIWFLIRSRRNCDHKIWMQELTWRIQASIINAADTDSNSLTFFLLDVFVSSTVVLSGYDAFFANVDEFNNNKCKKSELFPQSLCTLLSFQEWADMLPKMALWFQKLLKWKRLPEYFSKTFTKTLLYLREVKPFGDEKVSSFLFSTYSLG